MSVTHGQDQRLDAKAVSARVEQVSDRTSLVRVCISSFPNMEGKN